MSIPPPSPEGEALATTHPPIHTEANRGAHTQTYIHDTHTHLYTDTQADTPTHAHGAMHTHTQTHTRDIDRDGEQMTLCGECDANERLMLARENT